MSTRLSPSPRPPPTPVPLIQNFSPPTSIFSFMECGGLAAAFETATHATSLARKPRFSLRVRNSPRYRGRPPPLHLPRIPQYPRPHPPMAHSPPPPPFPYPRLPPNP